MMIVGSMHKRPDFTIETEIDALSIVVAVVTPIVAYIVGLWLGVSLSPLALAVAAVIGLIWGSSRIVKGDGEGK